MATGTALIQAFQVSTHATGAGNQTAEIVLHMQHDFGRGICGESLDNGTVGFHIARMALTPSTMLALGTAAPEFQLHDTHGKTVSLADFRAAPVLVVMFICNHCPYVKHLRAALAEFGRECSTKGVAVVAINSNDVANYPEDSPAKMAEEAKAAGYTFPYL